MNDIESLENQASEKVEEARAAAENALQSYADAGSELKSKAADAWEDFADLVKRHPAKALGITLAAGVAIGALASLSKRRRSYSSERLQNLAGTGADTWQRLASGFGKAIATLKDAAEDAAAKFK